MSLEGPNSHASAPPDPVLEILDFIKKTFGFHARFQGWKSQKTGSNASKKLQNSTPTITKNDFHEKSIFAILPCENDDFEVAHVENSSQKAIKNDLKIRPKIKRHFMHFEFKNWYKQVPKSFPNQQTSCDRQLRVQVDRVKIIPADSLLTFVDRTSADIILTKYIMWTISFAYILAEIPEIFSNVWFCQTIQHHKD